MPYGAEDVVREDLMSGTTVLERRNAIRRVPSGRPVQPTNKPLDGPLHDEGGQGSGGADANHRLGPERREYVPNHHITVGRVAGSGGWMGGVCSCGEHTLSKVEGFIEAWARWHRQEVMNEKSAFVHSS